MTRRRKLERHSDSLAEIRDIMNSMKTLAYMETRKLDRFLGAQHAVVRNIENIAADLISFYPESLPEPAETASVYLLIGTQRGFCGDFNRALLEYLESAMQGHRPGSPVLIAVGHRLCTQLEGDTRVAASIESASVAEEVTSVLGQIVHELSVLQEQNRMLAVYALYHSGEGGVVMQKLMPPFQHYLHRKPCFPYPPVLHEAPRQFLAGLMDHYLPAALHEILYTSLMAENRQRLTHLEGAVKRLDDESAELIRQCNALRQEEIIEEIEVILLSAGGVH